MRKVFGILFVVFAIVSLPSIFDTTGADVLDTSDTGVFIGHILAWLALSVIPAYFLLCNVGKKEDRENGDSQKEECGKEDIVKPKQSFIKKFFKALLYGVGLLFLFAAILGQILKFTRRPSLQKKKTETAVSILPFLGNDNQKATFARMIEQADRGCPIELDKGSITGIKLENGYVTYYLAYDSDFTNILGKIDDERKVKEGILMSLLCLNAQDDNRGDILMDELVKYGYGIKYIVTESSIGRFEFSATSDEIQELRGKYRSNPHEALYNLLCLSVEAERSSLPMEIGEGLTLTDYSLEGENIVAHTQFDDELYSVDEISANMKLLKGNILDEVLSDPSVKAWLGLCKVSHSGLKFIYTGKKSHKSVELLISSDEIRQNVQTPSQLNFR